MEHQETSTNTDQRQNGLAVATGSSLLSVGRFKPIKPGKIHMKCSGCGLTRSNMDRSEYDPTNAVVMVLNYCPRCDKGGGFEETTYYDANGKEITDDL